MGDNLILMSAVSLAVLVVSVIVFFVLMTLVLPKALLKVSYNVDKPKDRGVKKCLFADKHCMIYSSTKENKQFIKQYALVQEKGHKTLTCKLSSGVEYLDYDIVMFNRYNKVFKVMNVKEDIIAQGLTRTTVLPDETSYISIVIRKVNQTNLKRPAVMYMKGKRIVGFSLLAMLFTAIEGFVVRACCSYAFGGVFRESFISSMNGMVAIVLLSILTGMVGGISVAAGVKKRARK